MIEKYSWRYNLTSFVHPCPELSAIVTNRADPTHQTEANFITDSGTDYTVVGYDLIKSLNLKEKGTKKVPMGAIGTPPKGRDTIKVHIEISELSFGLSLDAIMVKPKDQAQANDPQAMQIINLNLLGRDFLNKLNVILLGTESRFWINCHR